MIGKKISFDYTVLEKTHYSGIVEHIDHEKGVIVLKMPGHDTNTKRFFLEYMSNIEIL